PPARCRPSSGSASCRCPASRAPPCPATCTRKPTSASCSPSAPRPPSDPEPESPMIETRDLTKMYGELYALDRLTLKLERGDVYGFIGPNGAGKTTTM